MPDEVLTEEEQVAAATTEESSASPEAAPAKEAETTEETPEKSSQQAAPAGEKDQEKQMPWHKDPRFQEFNAEYKEWKAKAPILEALAEKGITGPEAADELLAEVARYEEADKNLKHIGNQVFNDPLGLMRDLAQVAPESYETVYAAIGEQYATGLLKDKVNAYRSSGMDAEADFIEKNLMPQPKSDTRRRTVEQRNESIDNWQNQHLEEARDLIDEDVERRLRKKVDSLTGSISLDEEQKEILWELVSKDIGKVFAADKVFQGKIQRLEDSGLSREKRSEIAHEYERRALALGTFDKIVAKTLSKLRIQGKAKELPKEQREVATGGVAAPGSAEIVDREAKIKSLREQRAAGKISDVEFNEAILKLPPKKR